MRADYHYMGDARGNLYWLTVRIGDQRRISVTPRDVTLEFGLMYPLGDILDYSLFLKADPMETLERLAGRSALTRLEEFRDTSGLTRRQSRRNQVERRLSCELSPVEEREIAEHWRDFIQNEFYVTAHPFATSGWTPSVGWDGPVRFGREEVPDPA